VFLFFLDLFLGLSLHPARCLNAAAGSRRAAGIRQALQFPARFIPGGGVRSNGFICPYSPSSAASTPACRTPLGWGAGGRIAPRLTPRGTFSPGSRVQGRALTPRPTASGQRRVPELIPVGEISQNRPFQQEMRCWGSDALLGRTTRSCVLGEAVTAPSSSALPPRLPPEPGAGHSSALLPPTPGRVSDPRAGRGLGAHTCLAGGDAQETPSQGEGCVRVVALRSCPLARHSPRQRLTWGQAAAHQGWPLASPRPISGLSQAITA